MDCMIRHSKENIGNKNMIILPDKKIEFIFIKLSEE
jgi:hypothetical protein